MLVRPLVLAAALPAVAAAQGFEYAAGTTQYRITQVSKVTQEAMGQRQGGENTVNQTVTVTLNRSAKDTVAGVLVLDSVSMSSSLGPTPSLAHLNGLKVETRMAPNGAVVYSVQGPKEEEVPMASQATMGLGNFLPKIRGPLTRGSKWADTTSGTVTQFGIDISRKVVSTFTVVGDTTVRGESGWKIARIDTITVAGNGVGQMGAMSMEGSSATKGQIVMSSRGAFMGAESAEDGTVRVVLAANGAEIGITTSSLTKVERVK